MAGLFYYNENVQWQNQNKYYPVLTLTITMHNIKKGKNNNNIFSIWVNLQILAIWTSVPNPCYLQFYIHRTDENFVWGPGPVSNIMPAKSHLSLFSAVHACVDVLQRTGVGRQVQQGWTALMALVAWSALLYCSPPKNLFNIVCFFSLLSVRWVI
jgi:hypothetical protein